MKKPTKIIIISLLVGLLVCTAIPLVVIARLSGELEQTWDWLASTDATRFRLIEIIERHEQINELNLELLELNELLIQNLLDDTQGLQQDNTRLARELEVAERSLNFFRNPTREFWTARHIGLNDGRYLRYSRPNERGWVEYIHILDDIHMTEGYIAVYDRALREESRVWREYTYAVSQPSISPCGNLLTFVKIVEEWQDGFVIYNMRTGDWGTRGGIRAHWDYDETQTGPRDAVWLDERTVLILVKEIHGTPLRGGNLYALDLYKDTFTSLNIQLPAGGQIFSLQTSADMVYMDVLVDMHNAMLFNIYPHSVSFDEVRRLIANTDPS